MIARTYQASTSSSTVAAAAAEETLVEVYSRLVHFSDFLRCVGIRRKDDAT